MNGERMIDLHEANIAIFMIWVFLLIYSILGAIDFGSSSWAMLFNRKNTEAGEIANRFLSPSWEVTNTFLVLVVVASAGLFPNAAYLLGTVLIVPVSLTLILIAIRSAFMVFAYQTNKYQRLLRIISGVTGLLVPMFLITVLPISQGGFIGIEQGKEVFLWDRFWSSPSIYLYMLFALSTQLFLSALFLADYARESNLENVYQIYRKRAILIGPATVVIAIVTLLVLEPEANWLLAGLRLRMNWFIFSLFLFLVAYYALWIPKRKSKRVGYPRIAMIAVAFQYGFASFAYGIAHLPYIVYPYMTVEQGFTDSATFYALLGVYGVGLMILLPGFFLFWRLFLKDRRYLQKRKMG